MSLDKRLIGGGPAPRCGVTGFESTIETGTMVKNTSGGGIDGMAYGESGGNGYMALTSNGYMWIYNADGSSLGNKAITAGYNVYSCIYHNNKFWAGTPEGLRSYTISSSPTETLEGYVPIYSINWLCEDPLDSNRYFCGYRYDKNVYTISRSGFLTDTPALLFSNKIDYSPYGDGVGSITSDGDYIWFMAFNPSGNTTTIRQYDPATWDVYADSDYTTTAIGGGNYLGRITYNKTNNRMWHVRAYNNGANKYVPITGEACPTPNTTSVNFLVVAGGGSGTAGSYAGGAGGAGGLRTSYGSTSGGGGSAESSVTLTTGSTYAIVVGAGGAAPATNAQGNSGSRSVFATITSIGGGGGGGQGNPNGNNNGLSGGSGGGGASTDGSGGFTQGGAGTSGQGYNGGGNAGYNANPYPAGGGGGAGAAGGSATGYTLGGNGGVGLAVNILNATNATTQSVGEVSGSNVYYSGGGGGSVYVAGNTGGTGGLGGGGDAVNTGANAPSSAANTGGGGGSSIFGYLGGAGGSGVVILRMPTSNYSGTTTGSPTVTTDGSDTILTYTGSGTYKA